MIVPRAKVWFGVLALSALICLAAGCAEADGSCLGGDECVLECPDGFCNFYCADEASCTGSCAGGDCSINCTGNSSCNFTCSDGCAFHCFDEASCAFACEGTCREVRD